MRGGDELARLIERNRALLARATYVCARAAETVIVSQHLVWTFRENAAERRQRTRAQVAAMLNRRTDS